MTIKIGYARVSSASQSYDVQEAQLIAAGCSIVRAEKQSGSADNLTNRSELAICIEFLRPGDTLTVCKPDRLARSTRDLLNLVSKITDKDASLEVLSLGLNTATSQGKLMLTMLAAIAEFELALIKERQADGIAAAKLAGAYKGRKAIGSIKSEKIIALSLSGMTKDDIAEEVGVSRTTVFKVLKSAKTNS
jgi:DNA invertase Pin-like site-specific DNA recombinase